MSSLPVWVLGLAALIFLTIAGVNACSTGFSAFANYDDEGFMMISVQGHLQGYRLYDQVLTYYGPFYYFYEWLIHAVVKLPLTHDVTRAVCIFHRLLASSLLALAGGLMTRSVLMGFFVFMQAVLHLTPLAREPGHPQELVAVLLALAALVAVGGLQRRSTLALLGAIGAAAIFTKINVGAFFGLALALALCCHATLFQSRRALFGGLLALTSLVPFILMRPHLDQIWACIYAAQVCAAILAAGAVAYTFGGGEKVGLAHALHAGTAFVALSALFVLALFLTGSSLSSMLDNLVIGPSRLGDLFFIPLRVPYCYWSGAAALLSAAAALAFRSRYDRWKLVMAAAKGVYGLVGTLFLVSNYKEPLGYLLPWCWLVLVRNRADDASESAGSFARTFLCVAAIWEGLQAYPTAETQAVIGSFLPVIVYSVCLHDALKAFANEPWAIRHLGTLTQRAATLSEVVVLAGLVYLFVDWCKPFSGWRSYKSVPPLGLRGSNHLRLPAEQAGTYRELAQYLESQSDTFITIPGLNSLYFWTGIKPPTYFNASEVVLMNDDQQSRIVAALQNAKRPLIVVKSRGGRYAHPNGPLRRIIRGQCREVKKIGSFRILELEKNPAR